jgi:hypothetical protein
VLWGTKVSGGKVAKYKGRLGRDKDFIKMVLPCQSAGQANYGTANVLARLFFVFLWKI